MTTRDLLMETKNILLTRGWHQGALSDSPRLSCAESRHAAQLYSLRWVWAD